MAKETKTVYRQVVTEGGGTVARRGLGEMPLTLWVVTAGVVLYLYVRRASLGIDKHPAEKPLPAMRATAPPVLPPVAPNVVLRVR
jgi:hypothetical protein